MSLKPSIYDTIELVGKDNRTADIRFACVSIDYYEDILCPTVSAKIQIADSGGSIKLAGTNEEVSLYEGMKIRSGEQVRIIIEPNSASNVRLDFSSRKPLYLRKIKNLMREESREFFEMHLVSYEANKNEVSFLKKSYSRDVTISDHVRQIVAEFFPNSGELDVDQTGNKLGFIGNMMKPFEALIKLASKSAPSLSLNASAGFFFFQTKEGFKFKSIDNLANTPPVAEYFYSEKGDHPATFVSTPDLPSLDRKIVSYEIVSNQDIITNLKKGAYATDRRFFDPTNFLVTTPKRGGSQFTGDNYLKSIQTFGSQLLGETLGIVGAENDFTKLPSRILTETLDKGTVESKDVTKDETSELNKILSQRKMRYNQLFSQIITILVPLNSNISAGDSIVCNFPKITSKARVENDTEQISGKYLVKELCHHYDPQGSWTSMMIVRDTFGQSKSN